MLDTLNYSVYRHEGETASEGEADDSSNSSDGGSSDDESMFKDEDDGGQLIKMEPMEEDLTADKDPPAKTKKGLLGEADALKMTVKLVAVSSLTVAMHSTTGGAGRARPERVAELRVLWAQGYDMLLASPEELLSEDLPGHTLAVSTKEMDQPCLPYRSSL